MYLSHLSALYFNLAQVHQAQCPIAISRAWRCETDLLQAFRTQEKVCQKTDRDGHRVRHARDVTVRGDAAVVLFACNGYGTLPRIDIAQYQVAFFNPYCINAS